MKSKEKKFLEYMEHRIANASCFETQAIYNSIKHNFLKIFEYEPIQTKENKARQDPKGSE